MRPDVVAIVEDHRARCLEGQHRPHVLGHGGHGAAGVVRGVALAQLARFRQADASRHVPAQRIVSGGLVRDEIGMPAAADELRLDVGGIGDQRDAPCLAGGAPGVDLADRIVQVVGHLVHVAGGVAAVGAGRVDLDGQADALVHGHRQRLGATHAAQAGGQGDRALQAAVEVLAGGLGEGLVGALDDALGGDVDPGAGGHLAVHGQAGALQLAELLPGRPVGDEVGVGDQDPRGFLRRAEDADRLATLDQEGLVVLQSLELGDDGVEGLPAARRPARCRRRR